MGNLGWPEILIILVIALIIFGPRKLPELGKTLGQSLAQFRKASEDFKRTWEEEVEVEKHKLDAPKIAETAYTPSQEVDTGPQVTAEPPPATHWSDEPSTEAKPVPETAPALPTIVREGNAVPRQAKRDWM